MKPDTILKTFWRDNERFADLFNTVLFKGNSVLDPDELQPMISDYKLNLIQVKKCGEMKFRNNDINTVFDLVRLIYNQDYDKINNTYKNKAMIRNWHL